jgi:Rrf2 family iron-sulfur cluster assembly transcriptional regulator
VKLSTRGRYAVLALVDLGLHGTQKPVALVDIAARQDLSHQYLEQLFSKLRRALIVQSTRGQNGGYLLARLAKDITIAEIVNAVNEPIKATGCDTASEIGCRGQSSKCLAHDLWRSMDILVSRYLASISLEDIIEKRINDASQLFIEQYAPLAIDEVSNAVQ